MKNTFFLVSQVLSCRLKKRFSKNLVGTTFKLCISKFSYTWQKLVKVENLWLINYVLLIIYLIYTVMYMVFCFVSMREDGFKYDMVWQKKYIFRIIWVIFWLFMNLLQTGKSCRRIKKSQDISKNTLKLSFCLGYILQHLIYIYICIYICIYTCMHIYIYMYIYIW